MSLSIFHGINPMVNEITTIVQQALNPLVSRAMINLKVARDEAWNASNDIFCRRFS